MQCVGQNFKYLVGLKSNLYFLLDCSKSNFMKLSDFICKIKAQLFCTKEAIRIENMFTLCGVCYVICCTIEDD